jgi:hypothetical protein
LSNPLLILTPPSPPSAIFRLGIPLEDVDDNIETNPMIIQRQKLFLQTLFHDLFQEETDPPCSSSSTEGDTTAAAAAVVTPKVLIVSHGFYIKLFLKSFCSLVANEINNCSATTLRLHFQRRTERTGEGTTADCPDEETSSSSSSLHEWTVDGMTYLLVNVTPLAINEISHLASEERRGEERVV